MKGWNSKLDISVEEVINVGKNVCNFFHFGSIGQLVPDDAANGPDSPGAGVIREGLQHPEVRLREVLVEGVEGLSMPSQPPPGSDRLRI